MDQELTQHHMLDAQGNPAGGHTTGSGIEIEWQDGPLGRGVERIIPNGAFVEGVIQAAIDRLDFYQQTRFNSKWNAAAIYQLRGALFALRSRTADREAREVEGTLAL